MNELAKRERIPLSALLQEVFTAGYYDRLSDKNAEGVALRFLQRESGVTNAVRQAHQIISNIASGTVPDGAREQLEAIVRKLEKSENR